MEDSSKEPQRIQPSYKIHIFNLNDGDSLTYSLALLKGQIVATNKDVVEGQICVQVCDNWSKWPLTSGQFKVLQQLSRGWNDVKFKYRDCELVLKIEYSPRDTDCFVIPIYIVSHDHDGQFQGPESSDCSISSAKTRILLATKLLQSTLAEKLWEEGLGRRTFMIKEEEGCILHRSPLPLKTAQSLGQEQLWEHYGRELVTKWGGEQAATCKFLAFLACTRYKGGDRSSGMLHEEVLAHTKGHAALGGGGLAIFGTGCLHTWPKGVGEVLTCLTSQTPVDQAHWMDDSCYRGTFGGCCSTTLGSVLHELCHTFDLGHTSKGVMGRGFDHMELVFTPAEGDVNSNAPVHSTVDFSVNLKVECLVQERPSRQSPNCDPKLSRRLNVQSSNDDQTFFTQSCIFLLAYHRWLNTCSVGEECTINFDDRSWTLRSRAGVRVVEVREGERQLVRASWCFPHGRQLFVVPRSTLPSSLEPPLLLVAEDSAGTILRQPLTTPAQP